MLTFDSLVVLIGGIVMVYGNTISDSKACISKDLHAVPVAEKNHCIVTKDDVKLSCPPDKSVILLSLLLATKNIDSGCMKRILTESDEFCCNRDSNDVLYDGHCLQGVWNKEDRTHYQDFMNSALQKCMNTSKCILKSDMFANLQTEIPAMKTHSSYFRVVYRCIEAPTEVVEFCSSGSINEKEVHFQGSHSLTGSTNKTCTCRVTSHSGAVITVRAVDVRTAHRELILSSNSKTKNVSREHLPLFGLRDIFTDKTLNLSVKSGPEDIGENTWVQVSGSDGKDVDVICGESVPQIPSTTTTSPRPVTVLTEDQTIEFMGYWPLIYVASGSIFTILLVTCVLGFILICRNRGREKRHHHHHHPHHQCEDSVFPPPVDFHQDPRWHHYAAVIGDNQTISRSHASNQAANQFYDKPYNATYQGSSSPRNIDQQGAPTSSVAMECDVSQLEAFLNCNEHDQ